MGKWSSHSRTNTLKAWTQGPSSRPKEKSVRSNRLPGAAVSSRTASRWCPHKLGAFRNSHRGRQPRNQHGTYQRRWEPPQQLATKPTMQERAWHRSDRCSWRRSHERGGQPQMGVHRQLQHSSRWQQSICGQPHTASEAANEDPLGFIVLRAASARRPVLTIPHERQLTGNQPPPSQDPPMAARLDKRGRTGWTADAEAAAPRIRTPSRNAQETHGDFARSASTPGDSRSPRARQQII
mmetsp:Transcript_10995/g.34607  ORF Transcript_10995/g.34607 Transcript_10995/m.34607 type:complete len:238 (-) Transcript_10995:590-1303(-)